MHVAQPHTLSKNKVLFSQLAAGVAGAGESGTRSGLVQRRVGIFVIGFAPEWLGGFAHLYKTHTRMVERVGAGWRVYTELATPGLFLRARLCRRDSNSNNNNCGG